MRRESGDKITEAWFGRGNMAKLIEFYVPKNFAVPQRCLQPAEKHGKIIEFPSGSIKKSA
jgi:hypothetical protein